MHSIADPVKHVKVVEALVAVSDFLAQQEAGIPSESLAQPDQPRPLELLDHFGPIYCEVLESAGPERAAGRAAAAGGLCRLFCRLTDPVPLVVLQYVYAVVARELEDNPTSTAGLEMIANCGPLFALALPGSHGLIPYFLSAIKTILDGAKSAADVPDATLRNCITIVCSLLCFPSHFESLSIPVQMNRYPLPLKTRSVLTANDLLDQLATLLSKLLAVVVKAEHVFMVLCGLTVSVMAECRSALHGPPGSAAKALTNIIQRCAHEDPDIAIGALHCLGALAMDLAALQSHDASLIPLVLVGLSNLVIGQITSAESDKKFQMVIPTMVALFECLEEWALVSPPSVISMPSVNRILFSAIELGIFGGDKSAPSSSTASGGSKKKVRESSAPILSTPSSGALGDGGGTADGEQDEAVLHRPRASHGSREVSEAAEVLLRSMLNLHAQWPGPGGPEMTGTVLREASGGDEESDVNQVYYFANGSIVSLVPGPGERTVRMLIRDETDRFAWDARALFDDETVQRSLLPMPVPAASASSTGSGGAPTVSPSKSSAAAKVSNRAVREPPVWHAEEEGQRGVDKMDELLSYLNEVYDDCHYEDDTIEIAEEIKPLVEETARLMDKQQEAIENASLSERKMELATLPVSAPPTEPGHWRRLLLSHFNMVDYDQRAMFAMLESGTPLQRSINTLDTKRAREAFKFGWLCVCFFCLSQKISSFQGFFFFFGFVPSSFVNGEAF